MMQKRPKYIRRLYEPLLLLDALGQIRGDRIKGDSAPLDEHGSKIKHLRNFADQLAYIAAHVKLPEYVTAAALERKERFIKVWLAANDRVTDDVIEFITKILSTLQRVAKSSIGSKESYEDAQECSQLVDDVVKFSLHRIGKYYERARDVLQEAISNRHLDSISVHGDQHGSPEHTIRTLLHRLQSTLFVHEEPSEEFLRILPWECHKLRRDRDFRPLSSTQTNSDILNNQLSRLSKLLNKIGKHITATRKLLQATVALAPDFVKGFQVAAIPASKLKSLPLASKDATVKSTIGRMFGSPEEQSQYRDRLHSLHKPDEIQRILNKTRNNTKTRVHAELLLIDYFDRHGCDFICSTDKYIGCSKPSCYLCYTYVSHHTGEYKVSGSHQKLYVAWRMPDLQDGDSDSQQEENQKQIALKIIEKVRSDLIAETNSQAKMRPHHEDSSAGVTSDRGQPKEFSRVDLWFENLVINDTGGSFQEISGHSELGLDESSLQQLVRAQVQQGEDSEGEEGGVSL